jgi:hypothetical protein
MGSRARGARHPSWAPCRTAAARLRVHLPLLEWMSRINKRRDCVSLVKPGEGWIESGERQRTRFVERIRGICIRAKFCRHSLAPVHPAELISHEPSFITRTGVVRTNRRLTRLENGPTHPGVPCSGSAVTSPRKPGPDCCAPGGIESCAVFHTTRDQAGLKFLQRHVMSLPSSHTGSLSS